MLTATEVKSIVNRISMRGIEFRSSEAYPSFIVTITSRVPDTDDPTKEIFVTVAVNSYVPFRDETHLIDTIHEMVLKLYAHEANELFRIDGKIAFNPHDTGVVK